MNTIVIYHSILLLLQDCCMIKNNGGKNIYNVQFFLFLCNYDHMYLYLNKIMPKLHDNSPCQNKAICVFLYIF